MHRVVWERVRGIKREIEVEDLVDIVREWERRSGEGWGYVKVEV